jgi:uncharacterized protein (TIRG00374 family)
VPLTAVPAEPISSLPLSPPLVFSLLWRRAPVREAGDSGFQYEKRGFIMICSSHLRSGAAQEYYFSPSSRRRYGFPEAAMQAMTDAESTAVNQRALDRRHRKSLWRRQFAAALILIALLTVVLVRAWPETGFEWSRFTDNFRNINSFWMAMASLFSLLTYLGRALRWQIMIRRLKPNANLWRLFVATAIGFTAVVFFGRAGEMVRPYLIARKEGLPFSSQLAAWLLERIYDLLMALLIFGFALSRVQASGVVVGERLQWVLSVGGHAVGILATLSLAILFVLRQYSDWMRHRLLDGLHFLPPHYLDRVRAIVESFTEGVNSTRDTRGLCAVALYSLLEWAMIAAVSACVFQAFPGLQALTLTDVLIFVGFVSFGAVVQIPGVGGGLQIAAVIVLTELFKAPFETATAVALAFWGITFLVIVPAGMLLALLDGIKWRNLKHLEVPRPSAGV